MRWIIGDIHGMLRPLTTVTAQVRKIDADCRFIFVGDYINRGPNSKGVIDLLLSLDDASFIRGNHDDIFDLVINGECYADNATRGNRVAAFHWFMKYGLDNTLASYGCDDAMLERVAARCTAAHLDELAACVPQAHRQFIRNLPPAHEEADLFVVHGKWDPDELAEKPGIVERLEKHPKLRHRLLWGRYTEEEIARAKAWHRTGYFGHTPVSYYANLATAQASAAPPRMLPVAGTRMMLLDTAAALGVDGRLSAYCPDNGALVQSDHFGALIVEQAPGIRVNLPSHHLKLVLMQPQIAPNTGNIGRLCVATGTELHLVRPMGFVLSDRQLKRSAMDYWERLRVTVHDDTAAFFAASAQFPARTWLFSTKGKRPLWDVTFSDTDWLVFGSETQGLPEPLLNQHVEHTVCIPQVAGERCLNLATAAGIGLFEALRQIVSTP